MGPSAIPKDRKHTTGPSLFRAKRGELDGVLEVQMTLATPALPLMRIAAVNGVSGKSPRLRAPTRALVEDHRGAPCRETAVGALAPRHTHRRRTGV